MARLTQSVGVPSTAKWRVVDLLDAQRPVQRERVADRALLAVRRHDPHLAQRCQRRLQRANPGRVDAVVVRDEDDHNATKGTTGRRREVNRGEHGSLILS